MFVTRLLLLLSFACFLGAKGLNHCDLGIPCDDSQCIGKFQWCDEYPDCSDGSDERYCAKKNSWSTPDNNCDAERHFTCQNRMCIPKVLRCDEHNNCLDNSDENGCCYDVVKPEGSISGRIEAGGDKKYYDLCWKFVLKENELLSVLLNDFHSVSSNPIDCKHGNITFELDYVTGVHVRTICPHIPNYSRYLLSPDMFPAINAAKIRYTIYYPFHEDRLDVFNITYSKINRDCLRPEMLICSEISCVSKDKQCDGIKDCENGLDEQDCGFVDIAEDFFENNRILASRWMRSQHDADWGWKENTARAVVALYLSNDLNFNATSHEDDLVAKQLELEVSTFLLRNSVEKAPITEMATYINALQAICHNPRNFYGFDLVENLKNEIEATPNYVTPFPYLTLCNAKETVSERAINSLLQIISKPSDFGFALEIQALASMALSCISRSDQYAHLKQNLTEHLNKIKEKQKEDGSFGNEYTTALVIQALIANNQSNDRDWKFKAAAKYLERKQKPDGSFGNFLTTYLIMPVMNGKSLVDISRVNCTESLNRPREGNLVSDIKNRLGGKIPVKYSLIIGDNKDQILPILLRTPENITVLELMTLAADIDPKYKFKIHKTEEKTYVYEISSIPNDPEKNKFWFLYQQIGNDTELSSKQCPDEVSVGENYHMILWYRTLIM